MGKQTAQGTRHESAIRNRALLLGRDARRNAKLAQANESDVTITGQHMRGAVFWKWYRVGGQRRTTFRTVTIEEDFFWELYALDTTNKFGLEIQAKATQRLSVGTTLLGVLGWMKQ